MRKGFLCLLLPITLLSILTTVIFGKIIYEREYAICAHSGFEEQTVEPDCQNEGRITRKCTRCSYKYIVEFLPKTEHSFASDVVVPTCAAQGYTLFYCKCGYSYCSDFVSPTEHTLECISFDASCTEQGYLEYSCSDCNYSFKTDFVAPHGHDFGTVFHRPTATVAGYTEYTCECGYGYKGDHVYYTDILESAYTENTHVLARGCDVSRWNHQIDPASGKYLPLDFELIRNAGFDFVIIKAGSTKSGIEPTFEADYAGARAAGLEVGVYYYTYSKTEAGILQDARSLMLWLEDKQLEYPVYLDIEDSTLEGLGKNHLSNMCVAFLEELQRNGYYAGLYTNHKWLTGILDTAKMVTLFDIWYARYPETTKPTWNEEKYGKQLGMWQYTQSGKIDGLAGEFDFNYCYKDYSEIMKKWGLNGY